MSTQFDAQDIAALRSLDSDFVFSTDGETAKVTGEMQIEITRPADDEFLFTVTFPGGAEFVVRLLREPSLESWTSEARDER